MALALIITACTPPLILTACASRLPGPDALAVVDGEELPWSVFEAYLEEAGGQMALALSAQASSRLLDQFLDEVLLHRQAVASDLVDETASRREAAAALTQSSFGDEALSPAELRSWYEANRHEFEMPPRVRLRQVLTDRRAAAAQALEELEAGAEFEAVVRRWSIDPSRERGGDQGLLALTDLPVVLARAVEGLEPGEISGIVPTEYGFHIFEVAERLAPGRLPFAAVEPQVRERVHAERSREALDHLVAEARRRYNVRVVGQNLPFAYRGDYPLETR